MIIQFEISNHLYKCLKKRIELGVASELDMLVDKGTVIEREPKTDGDCISRQAYDKGFDDGLEEGLKVGACEDCISRQEVLDMMQMRLGGKELYKAVYELPPVTPAKKVGYWEWVQYDGNPNIGSWHCSECRTIIPHMPVEKDGKPIYKCCPYCMTRMEVDE